MKSSSGLSLVEILVILVIIGFLASMRTNCGHIPHGKAKLSSASSSAGGIVKLCALMQVDEIVSGDTNVCSWPTNAAYLPRWMNSLTNYSGTNDLAKLFSAEDVKVTSWTANKGPNTNAYFIYPVTSDSPANAILMTSRNYRLPSSGKGPALVATDKPFGTKGAIVVTKGGSSQVITARQATNDVSTIGIVEGAPLN